MAESPLLIDELVVTPIKRGGKVRHFWRAFVASKVGLVGLAFLIAIALVAIFAPVIAPDGPFKLGGPRLAPIGTEGYPLGTDHLGRSILSQLAYGARVSLSIGLVAAAISMVVGVVIGSLAGFYGGWVDIVLSRLTDMFLIIPAFFLIIVIVATFGSGIFYVMIVIGLTAWPTSARLMRAQALSLRERTFVQGLTALGESKPRILFRHVVPNGIQPLIANASLDIAGAILIEAGLSFIGLGDPNKATWGRMIFEGRTSITTAWWVSVLPGIAIVITVLGFYLVGDGISYVPESSQPEGEGMNEQPPLLELRNLSVTYRTDRGVVSAVDDVSLKVPMGASIGLVGESGSGKSTIAMALLRLLPANARVSGEIIVNGTDLVQQSEAELNRRWRWSKLSMVFQKSLSALSPVHRIGVQMHDVLQTNEPTLSERDRNERIDRVLSAVHLPKRVLRSYPFELSGGMMQRTMISLGLLCDPPFVIFDEATTALDVITQSQILTEIQRLKQEFDLTTMVISHDVGVINAITDIVAVLYAGQLMEVAPREVFFREALHPYSRALIGSIPRLSGKRERIQGIPGSLPDLTNPPLGCRFAPRCPHATAGCMTSTPPMVEVQPGHMVRCTEFALKDEVGQ